MATIFQAFESFVLNSQDHANQLQHIREEMKKGPFPDNEDMARKMLQDHKVSNSQQILKVFLDKLVNLFYFSLLLWPLESFLCRLGFEVMTK